MSASPTPANPTFQSYTVLGLWYQRTPIVAGVIAGEHDCVDQNDYDRGIFSDRWVWSGSAASPSQAESMAVDDLQAGEQATEAVAADDAVAQHEANQTLHALEQV